jgi:hypothetical protein
MRYMRIVSKNSHRIISDRFGNLYSTQNGGRKCHCGMCGVTRADSNRDRVGYLRVRIYQWEDGMNVDGLTKRETRGLRRTREKRIWRQNLNMEW